jgi:hypothetical protein
MLDWRNAWWISADGVLHGPVDSLVLRQEAWESVDMRVCSYMKRGPPVTGNIVVEAKNCASGQLRMQFNGVGKGVAIDVIPTSDDDLAAVALAQAMLSQGLVSSHMKLGHVWRFESEGRSTQSAELPRGG